MDAQVKTRVTFAEYDALPETNQIVELIDGEIVVNPPPLDKHQESLGEIYVSLRNVLKVGKLRFAPTGLRFDDGSSFEPDIFWVGPDNTNCLLEPEGRYWHGPPDLVIEILSPSTASNDRGIKYETYEKYGVREYWLVDPDAKFTEVYRHDSAKFARQGVFKAKQSFVSAALNGAMIDTQSWFSE